MKHNHIELNNAITQTDPKTGFYNLEKDQEALAVFLEEVKEKTMHFPDEIERLIYLVDEDFYFDVFEFYEESFLKKLIKKSYSYNHKFASYMAATKFYQDYALKTNDKKMYLENIEQHNSIVALYLAQGDENFATELLDALMLSIYQPATPTYLNAGRTRRGDLASCYLLQLDDSLNSINYNEGVARQLSKMGGGVALNLSRLRARSESIKGIEGVAKGVLPVAKSLEMSFQYADQLGQRPGAGAVYLNIFHADLPEFLDTKKVNADEGLRLATISTGVIVPSKFMELAKANKPFFMFYPHNVYKVYGKTLDDINLDEMYDDMVANPKIRKREASARDILNQIAKMQLQSGYPYLVFKDNANKVHPLKNIGEIKQSNLCVSGDTKILTKEYGYVDIQTVSGQDLFVWNGQEWSLSPIRQTGENQELVRVTLSNGMHLDCTPYHKFYVQNNHEIKEVRASELKQLDTLIDFDLPNENKNTATPKSDTLQGNLLELQERGIHSYINDDKLVQVKAPIHVTSIDPLPGKHDTYCFNEPRRHMGMFNGILTGQCSEILQLQETSTITNYGQEDDIKRDIVCNLGSINIVNIMESDDFYAPIKSAMKALTTVTDLSQIENAPGVRKANDELHSVGLGVMNLHGFLAKNHIEYESEEAKEFASVFFAMMNYYSLLSSCNIARTRRVTFKDFDKSEYANGNYFDQYLTQEFKPQSPKIIKLFEKFHIPSIGDWEYLKKRVQKYGLYHAYRLAIAPTQSISYVQNATSSVMPVVDLIERRSYGNAETYYPMPFLDVITAHYYKSAYMIDQMKLIDLISVIQPHIDQGISTILYVNSNISTRELSKYYAYAHHKGLKSLYYTRNKLLSIEECTSCSI